MPEQAKGNVIDPEFQRKGGEEPRIIPSVSQTTGAEQVYARIIRHEYEQEKPWSQPRPYGWPSGQPNYIKINLLPSRRKIHPPLDAVVEPDNGGYLARLIDLPLYGSGEDPVEAIEMLKEELESLYNDLMEDDDFSEDWLRVKSWLGKIVSG